jgi:capsular polysaccharide biosynthesis protein
VELNEAIDRIVRHHWKLISACVVFGLAVALIVPDASTTYTASARVVLNVPDPTTVSEAAAVADMARAIATGPQTVGDALRSAGLTDDPVSFAKNNVSVSSLGSSGVLQVSVKEAHPAVAQTLANALSDALVKAPTSAGGQSTTLQRVDTELATLANQISHMDQRMAGLSAEAAREGTGSQAQIQMENLAARRSTLASQQTVAQSARYTLIVSMASTPQARVVAPAERPTSADASPLIPNVVLGLLLGLILGLALATGAETVSPTVVGGRGAARVIGAPLLGSIHPSRLGLFDPSPVAERIRIVAASVGDRVVELVPATGTMDLEPLASGLRDGLKRARGSDPSIRVFDGGLDGRRGVGQVLVVPHTIKRRELDEAADLLSIGKTPLLGILSVRGSIREDAEPDALVAEVTPRSEASRSEASRSEASRSEASRSEASRSEARKVVS